MLKWLNNFNKKSSKGQRIFTYNTFSEPIWTSHNYASLAKEGYKNNIIVYRCINLISRSIASVKLNVYKNNQELASHPLLNIINNPNPGQSRSVFFESMIGYLLLSGNSYINVVCNDDNLPVELYNLRPDRINIIPDAKNISKIYEYEVNGNVTHFNVDEELHFSPILHIKLFNPLDDWYGMSPVEAAAKSIDQHNAVSGHNLSLLQNGGRPSGCLMIKNSEYELSEEQRDALRNSIKESYEGMLNSGKVMVLEGDFEWKEMGLSPKDLDFIAGKKLSAREIAQSYGVPPILVGIEGDATFANYKEARYHFWEDSVLPMLDYILDEFNMWLAKRYDSSIIIRYDEDTIPALAPKREKIWNKITNASFLTLNEKREALGYSPLNYDKIEESR